MSLYLEIFGWCGSALLVFSVLQTKFLRFRILNGVASLALMVYNACLGVWPAVAMNGVLVVINAYFLWRLTSEMRRQKAFSYAEASPATVEWFASRHGGDLLAFNPRFAKRGPDTKTVLLYHESTAIGLVAFDQTGAEADLLADYVVAAYRDYSPGQFVFSATGPLRAMGVARAVYREPGENVVGYLEKLGFTGDSQAMALDLPEATMERNDK
ncbi:MAG: YgjV family protein [Propionibacteriaceae bacterium]|nr:YgjV family protein [Propionibacteriaceae bacterium]